MKMNTTMKTAARPLERLQTKQHTRTNVGKEVESLNLSYITDGNINVPIILQKSGSFFKSEASIYHKTWWSQPKESTQEK